MPHIALHNALYLLLKQLGARGAGLKLAPHGVDEGATIEVAVGDTEGLYACGWREDAAPELAGGEERTIFGHACGRIYPLGGNVYAWRLTITEGLLRAIPSQFKHSEKRDAPQAALATLWLALDSGDHSDVETTVLERSALIEHVLGVTAQIMWGLHEGANRHIDAVTRLPDAAELRRRVIHLLMQQSEPPADYGVGLVLVGIDDFATRRKAQGYDRVSRLAYNTAQALTRALRKDDELFAYRESQFAVAAQFRGEDACRRVAGKLMEAFEEAAFDASISIGYVFNDGTQTEVGNDVHALCMCAEQALNHATLLGGSQIISFTGTFDGDEYILTHPLGALMTDPGREQRNTRILWQTVALMNAADDTDDLCSAFTALLNEGVDATGVWLLTLEEGSLRPLGTNHAPLSEVLRTDQQRWIRQAMANGRTLVDHDIAGRRHWLAAPVKGVTTAHGVLVLASSAPFDAADQVFFKSLADQLAGALERTELLKHRAIERDAENEALRARLSIMPRAPVEQIVESPAMREVQGWVDQVAPTDVSVLIVGESGAGKEVMAHGIHRASPRAEQPFVVVDCSAITHSLIDSELFGRVKGAFTGADAASPGRIAQAQGGTLFLDEIGELPLDVQSKLLRFVQEKEVVAVGGTQTEVIDTRIICATNRDLLAEVEAGRFRADLYYRLQVVQVTVPPLRQRREDLPDLVRRMLRRFAEEFSKPIDDLSPEAWELVSNYPWPGNVRELQNTLLRACLSSASSVIQADNLAFSGAGTATTHPAAAPPPVAAPAHPLRSTQQDTAATTAFEPGPSDPYPRSGSTWEQLTHFLRAQLDALNEERLGGAPIGRWFNDALVLTALACSGEVTRSAARILDLPETTLRRQVAKARTNAANPLYVTSRTWQQDLGYFQELLRDLFEAHTDEDDGLHQRLEALLLDEVAAHAGEDGKLGAALMGITPPTYARRLARQPTLPALSRAADSGGRLHSGGLS